MYLRKVKRKNKDGSQVTYLQLAQNEWDPKAKYAKARVIYSLGRTDQVDAASLERLAKSITRFLSPEEALKAQENIGDAIDFRFESSKRLGGAWLLHQLWRKLELDDIFKDLLRHRHHDTDIERLLFAMVANRALSPSSKLAMEDWVRHDVAIPALEEVSSQQLYRTMDVLLEVRDALEKQVYFSVANLLNLEVDLIYFDTTSSYFEVEPHEAPEGENFRQLGYSKDHRPDLLQTVIGLAVTREGIPIRCWAWPGNTSDMSVVEEVKNDLVGWKLGRVISVVDRGFSSEDNLRYLQRAGGHYIAGERMRAGKPETEEALARKGRYHTIRDNLKAKEIIVGDGEARKRFVLVSNPKEADKARKQRASIVETLTKKLEELGDLSGKQHTKAVCDLRSHKVYGRYLRQLKNGQLKRNKQAIRDAARYDGKYLIRTSDDTLSVEDVALGYKQLIEVETSFRDLKSSLNLRPMHHRLEERIQSHILVNWLALLLIRVAEVQTKQTWRTIRKTMNQMHLGHYSSEKGDFQQRTEITHEQRQILSTLGLEAPPKVFDIQAKT
ncbi:IS1634 family transposase [Salicibibacter halophilus]|uniref:IS1634 family transposase n=1 Tax=Salicibibacter halophilus TaxID=2502791 RepID=A0A514LMQ3_9BACI|nr:IS1634 family transposase [Salicibibacter halophilus]QDI90161.1 IS1634 family transposase [Salicibibacter halophilus]QDI93093.1 IS1634 family transposase [Salicibibacter halophilus]